MTDSSPLPTGRQAQRIINFYPPPNLSPSRGCVTTGRVREGVTKLFSSHCLRSIVLLSEAPSSFLNGGYDQDPFGSEKVLPRDAESHPQTDLGNSYKGVR
jgi:hypothetical protein